MLQCGMLIPMHERSHAGIFSSIFIDIGDEQSIEDDLSTYSSHLTNMKIMMKSCNERSLILIMSSEEVRSRRLEVPLPKLY